MKTLLNATLRASLAAVVVGLALVANGASAQFSNARFFGGVRVPL